MKAAVLPKDWIARLPQTRGELRVNAPLADLTWFRVGGPADVFFRPEDEDDLIAFLEGLSADVPVTILGVGSNVLVRDGGIEGVVMRLGRGLSGLTVTDSEIRVGAGASDVNVAMAAARAGLTGLEFLRGIPGTIGGALRMNAGAYGREIADVFVSARAVDRAGRIHGLAPDEMGFAYRRTDVPPDWIFLDTLLKGAPGDTAKIKARMTEISAERELSQPVKTATGGSTFKNPNAGDPQAKRAWQLIDAAGCRGLKRGGAQVSPQHCNFLVNTGTATAADLEALGEDVRRRVRDTQGVDLEWEIRIIGRPANPAEGRS